MRPLHHVFHVKHMMRVGLFAPAVTGVAEARWADEPEKVWLQKGKRRSSYGSGWAGWPECYEGAAHGGPPQLWGGGHEVPVREALGVAAAGLSVEKEGAVFY